MSGGVWDEKTGDGRMMGHAVLTRAMLVRGTCSRAKSAAARRVSRAVGVGRGEGSEAGECCLSRIQRRCRELLGQIIEHDLVEVLDRLE
jgi:hypothetical protein